MFGCSADFPPVCVSGDHQRDIPTDIRASSFSLPRGVAVGDAPEGYAERDPVVGDRGYVGHPCSRRRLTSLSLGASLPYFQLSPKSTMSMHVVEYQPTSSLLELFISTDPTLGLYELDEMGCDRAGDASGADADEVSFAVASSVSLPLFQVM